MRPRFASFCSLMLLCPSPALRSDQVPLSLTGTARLASQLGDEGGALQAEQPSGGLLVTLRPTQRLVDEPILELLDGAVEVDALLGKGRTRNLFLGNKGPD